MKNGYEAMSSLSQGIPLTNLSKPDVKDSSTDKGVSRPVPDSHPHSHDSLDLKSNVSFNDARSASTASAQSTLDKHFGPRPELTAGTARHPGDGGTLTATDHHSLSFGNIFHNVLDVGATLAGGVKDAAVNAAVGVAHGVENVAVGAAHGIEHGAEWAYEHPEEAAAIAVVGTAAVGAVVLTGGAALALPALEVGATAVAAAATSSAAATTLEVAGMGIAAYGTVKAAVDVTQHGELSTLMDQQNHSPEQVEAARAQLKEDTGSALLNDSLLGVGLAAKGIVGARIGAKAAAATEGGVKAANATAGTSEAGERAAEVAKLAHKGSAAGSNLADGRLSVRGDSLASSAHVDVLQGTMKYADGTSRDVFFHAEEMEYGRISPAATAARLQKEQGSFQLNKIIGFDQSYPESQSMTATINGQVNKGWIQEAAGKPLEGVLKERALSQFGTTSNMNEDVAKILENDPALRSKVEDAVVERIVYGDKDIGAKNLGVSTSEAGTQVRNFDMGEGYSTNVVDYAPSLSSYQNSLTTIGLQNAMSGRPLSAEMTQKLAEFVAKYGDANGAERLSQATGLSAEQTTGVVARARLLAADGKLPTVDPKINDPDNISFYRIVDSH